MMPVLAIMTMLAAVPDVAAVPASGSGSKMLAQEWSFVVDRAEMLDDGQERSAIHDAWRLNLYDIPTQVVTEGVMLTQDQADARAREIRISDGIESEPGADDGLLIYAASDPYHQSALVMSISIGQNTLPRNGLTASSLDDIRVRIVDDQLAKGHPARAIVYSLREMIYLEQYVPPPAPPLTGWRDGGGPVVSVFTPIIVAASGMWLIRRRRLENTGPMRHPATLASFATITVVVIVLAVVTKSELGIICAGILGGVVIWLTASSPRTGNSSPTRRLVATPRPPGSRTVARPDRASSR